MTTILDRLRTHARANSGQFEVCLSIQEVREIVRALEPAWQPIDSAPKDQEVIIAVMAEGRETIVGEARFWASSDDWWWAGTTPKDYFAGPISEMNFGAPTHWMPLPSPPLPLSSPAEVAAFIDSMDGGTKRIEG